jgi:3',5'-cyclic AMP phosphodiesterase CpdA
MRIVHLSDLHIPNQFVEEWGKHLVATVNDSRPDVVVVSGDLTDEGYVHEYEQAFAFVKRLPGEKLVVPGNHDARNKGYELFEDMFHTRYPIYEDEGVVIIGMDSSEPDIDEGRIGREHYPGIREACTPGKRHVLVLHHHVIPIPGTGRERNILIDAGDVLHLCVDANIDLVLSGHKHLPWIWRLEQTLFVTAGTACSRKLKGRSYPSFNIVDIDDECIVIREMKSTDGAVMRQVRFGPTTI